MLDVEVIIKCSHICISFYERITQSSLWKQLLLRDFPEQAQTLFKGMFSLLLKTKQSTVLQAQFLNKSFLRNILTSLENILEILLISKYVDLRRFEFNLEEEDEKIQYYVDSNNKINKSRLLYNYGYWRTAICMESKVKAFSVKYLGISFIFGY